MASFSNQILLKTKISLPAFRENLLVRKRLIRTITQGLQGRLTTVCAPAGFGKSTLVSQWIHQCEHSTAWVSLDETDNDLIRFWRYIMEALTAINDSELGVRLSYLTPLLPSLSENTFIDALINELCTVSSPIVLVLDDYHEISRQPIHDSLSYFIDYLPQHLHVIIASRSEIPFSASKWLARGELNHIDILQLQFTVEETKSFYQEVVPLPLTSEHIQKLFQQTEGWITGLQLASISLRSNTNYDQYIDSFNGYHRNVADYLFQEVLAKLPSPIHAFLLQTCVLERMDAAACEAVTDQAGSREMLERLLALNLFVIPLDEHNTWFRYHHLFSDFLRNRLKRSDTGLWLKSNQSASRHFAARGLLDRAIEHAILGEHYISAARLLNSYAAEVLKRGELSTLLHWIEAISPHTELSADMSLLHTFLLVMTGQGDRAAVLLDKIEQQSADLDTDQRKQILSGLLFVKSNLVFYSGNYDQWYEFAAEKLDGELPENPLFYNFNYNMTEPLVRRTAFGLKGSLSSDTEAIAARFTAVLESHGWNNSLINLYVVQSLCEGYYEWNRLDECLKLVRQVERSDRFEQIPGLFVPNRITLARIQASKGNYRLAHETIDEAIHTIGRISEYYWLHPLRAFRVRLYLQETQMAPAKREMAGLHLAASDRHASNRMFEYVTLSRFLIAQAKEAEATRLLEQLMLQASKEQCQLSMAEISCLQALVELQRGQRLAALHYLHEALVIGETNGYIRTFLDEGKSMAKLLQTYVYQRETDVQSAEWQGVTVEYVQRLLALFPQVQDQKDTVLIEPLSQQELFILKLLRQGASNRQIAEALALTEGTVKVYLSRIYSKLGVSSRTQALVAAQELLLFEA
ncbi:MULTISPECIES: LuxR C-terminal-related transcriptional regulator [unclassified Paenibacillus]|uniref:LuxR C-terminal-related transcriptional regulator n=1 Tax=unclassified Paenibacillus TaxID=185978 RepID=UPI003634953E